MHLLCHLGFGPATDVKGHDNSLHFVRKFIFKTDPLMLNDLAEMSKSEFLRRMFVYPNSDFGI